MEAGPSEPVSSPTRVAIGVQLAYGVGHVLNDVCASMWFSYLIVFFHLCLQFSNWESGFVLLVGQVADASATPLVGFGSDRTTGRYFCGMGRRKLWYFIGLVCVITSFPFIFAPSPLPAIPTVPTWGHLLYYCVFVVTFQFGWASMQISNLSLIPELTSDEHVRTKLTAIRYCFTVLSSVLIYSCMWLILQIHSGSETQIGPDDVLKFQIVVWIALGVGGFCSFIFMYFIKEPTLSDVDNTQLTWATVRELFANIHFYLVAILYMGTRLFVNLTTIFMTLYLHETLGMMATALAIIPLVVALASFTTSMATGFLNKTLGRVLAYITGATLGVLGCVWIQLRSDHVFIQYEIFAVALVFGSACSIMVVTSLAITADLIGDRTGTGAFVYGLMSFTDKLSNGIAVVIIQYLHVDKEGSTFYRDVISFVCGSAAIMGTIAVIFMLKRFTGRRAGYEPIPGEVSINNDDNQVVTT